MAHVVACLDVWAPAVREVVRRVASPAFDLRFAESYDADEQHAMAEQAEFLLPGWAAVTDSMLARAAKLRMIQKWGIGYDRIDVEAARRALDGVLAFLEGAQAWDAAAIGARLRDAAEELGQKPGDVFMLCRLAVTGRAITPPLFESMALIGREASLARLHAARALIEG